MSEKFQNKVQRINIQSGAEDAAIRTALGEATVDEYPQFAEMAIDIFKSALEQHRPYGVALATAYESLRGYTKEGVDFASVEAGFWDKIRDHNIRENTREERDVSGQTDVIQNASEKKLNTRYRLRETDPFRLPVERAMGAAATSSVAEEVVAVETSEKPAEEAARKIEVELSSDEAEEVIVKHERPKKDKKETRFMPVAEEHSWARSIEDLDADILAYNGNVRGKKVENQPILNVGYESEPQEYDCGILSGEDRETRGAIELKTEGGDVYYVSDGYIIQTKLEGKRNTDIRPLRVKGLKAAVGKPLELRYHNQDDDKEEEAVLDGVVSQAMRFVPFSSDRRRSAAFDEDRMESKINSWNWLSDRMDEAVAKHVIEQEV